MKILKYSALIAAVMMATPMAWSMQEKTVPKEETVLNMQKKVLRLCYAPLNRAHQGTPTQEQVAPALQVIRRLPVPLQHKLKEALGTSTKEGFTLLISAATSRAIKETPSWLGAHLAAIEEIPVPSVSDYVGQGDGKRKGPSAEDKRLDCLASAESARNQIKREQFTVETDIGLTGEKLANPFNICALRKRYAEVLGQYTNPHPHQTAYARIIADLVTKYLTTDKVFSAFQSLGEKVTLTYEAGTISKVSKKGEKVSLLAPTAPLPTHYEPPAYSPTASFSSPTAASVAPLATQMGGMSLYSSVHAEEATKGLTPTPTPTATTPTSTFSPRVIDMNLIAESLLEESRVESFLQLLNCLATNETLKDNYIPTTGKLKLNTSIQKLTFKNLSKSFSEEIKAVYPSL